MKKNVFLVCALALLYSCGGPTTYEPIGTASYYITNLRSSSITIKAVTQPGPPPTIVSVEVPPQETVKLMDFEGLGVNPHPELSFISLEAFDQFDTSIYTQNPINNSAWTEVIVNPHGADYYHTDYTLQIP